MPTALHAANYASFCSAASSSIANAIAAPAIRNGEIPIGSACNLLAYNIQWRMIRSFKHKGLKKLFQDDARSGIRPDQAERIENILSMLNVAEKLKDLALPSLKLHPLKGELKGFHAVTVRANWRIVFRFEDGDCFDLDLVDYH